ncbi:TauD/TfdA family dioxygenase [Streptosporangiaceae bacterium NEAU-GS5]|nr:TauD/TfdA family dioxygenase [Streptosporangiaceae bacterium NEAU-GS5]
MALTIVPIRAGFVAEVAGFDGSAPDGWDAEALHAALRDYSVLVTHETTLTPQRQVALTSLLGDVEEASDMRNHHPDSTQVMVVHTSGDTPIVGNQCWHADRSFSAEPTRYTVLYGKDIPPSAGDTLFADMVAAYSGMPSDWKRSLAAATGTHSYDKLARMRAEIHRAPIEPDYQVRHPPVRHPIVRAHPETGAPALFVSELCLSAIDGQGAPEPSIDELLAHATSDDYVHRHRWQAGDIVIWDNSRVLHRAAPLPPGTTRVLHRTTTSGPAPVTAHLPGGAA